MSLPETSAILLAAGKSRRLPGEVRKPLRILAGKPILAHTTDPFMICKTVCEIVIVVNEDDLEDVKSEFAELGIKDKISAIVAGGATRVESAAAGIEALASNTEYILLHDGVRPLVTVSEIEAVIGKAIETGGAILAERARDTVKMADENGMILETVPRDKSWFAQTPQVFRLEEYRKALKTALSRDPGAYTDDAQMMEAEGHPVAIVEGSPRNIKITYPDDLVIVESYLLP
ncbi:MAG: 2-C-methyl-D-erythritol 4-phosphate cytidylyltransferase [Planctomycetota bacterium]|jgi:2-C-methyl-D-erythritol 4-phosphate cytidylyltransferase